MATDLDLSTGALVVALVALIMTISQVMGQFFATADGYRRCQSSVMGEWAKLTRRKFRWREIRFETLYSTPRFGLFPFTPGQTLSHEMEDSGALTSHFLLDGSPNAIRSTLGGTVRKAGVSAELVSWVRFIQALHYNSRETLTLLGYNDSETTLSPTAAKETSMLLNSQKYFVHDMRIEERSWDFVPPEVVRPLAVVNVSDLGVMARRLGMLWKQFDPLEGNLRAEGNGYTISSTLVRSMGTVLQIGVRDPLPDTYDEEQVHELYIPSEAADKMGFGIVSGQPGFGLPEYKMGTEIEVLALLNQVDPTRQASDTIRG